MTPEAEEDNTEVTAQIPVTRISGGEREACVDRVVVEYPLTIYINGKEFVTLLCTPQYLMYLVLGFLSSEGCVQTRSDVLNLTIDEHKGLAWVEIDCDAEFLSSILNKRIITTGCGKGTVFYSAGDLSLTKTAVSGRVLPAEQIAAMSRILQSKSKLFHDTGGVHSALMLDHAEVLCFFEDIGRHNAVDKIFGKCLNDGIDTSETVLVISGRISSEIVLKTARHQVPVIVSRSAPTDRSIAIADKLSVTLIGFARGNRMNVYSHERRVT